jgi:hypothetical protein
MSGMAKEKMDYVQELIKAQRYREARGILETDPDINQRTAQKWLIWLDQLHREERVQAGVETDKHKTDPTHAFDELWRVSGGTLMVVLALPLLWLIINQILTFASASFLGGALFLIFGLAGGYLGWQWAARFIWPSRSFIIGMGIMLFLFFMVLSSGIPARYFYEPPLRYLFAACALVLPAVAYGAYWSGSQVGLLAARLYRRLTGFETPPEGKAGS